MSDRRILREIKGGIGQGSWLDEMTYTENSHYPTVGCKKEEKKAMQRQKQFHYSQDGCKKREKEKQIKKQEMQTIKKIVSLPLGQLQETGEKGTKKKMQTLEIVSLPFGLV